jgi:ATP-dependent protease HslVU (ClpYQ) peptidase subunit
MDRSRSQSSTAISAVTTGSKTWMGGDRAIIHDGHIIESDVSKVVRKESETEELLIGLTGCIRALNLIRHNLELPERSDGEKSEMEEAKYVMQLAETLRTVFREGGALTSRTPEEWCGRALIGTPQKLYQIGPRFSTVPMAEPIGAVGSGKEYAVAALRGREPGEEAVRESLRAAVSHDPEVKAPIGMKEIPT